MAQQNTGDLKSFSYLENSEVIFSNYDTIKSTKQLDSGTYSVCYLDHPDYRVQVKQVKSVETIKIHAFPDRDKIDQLFKSFFNPKVVERIEKLGFNHKIGILLHGKEGTGKSTIGKYYCDQALVNHKAIIFNFEGTEPHHIIKCWDFITNIRRIQSNPIVVVFEEIDQLLKREGEGLLKRILDGDSSISNCIFLATTNYIDEIPDAIKYRPSRFKYCLNIEGIQSISDVQLIMMRMLSEHCSEEEVKEFAIELQGNTLDVIKQFCIDKIMNLKTYEKPKKTVGFKTKS